jgi:hypothetical protein
MGCDWEKLGFLVPVWDQPGSLLAAGAPLRLPPKARVTGQL